MSYVDGFILAIPKANKTQYIEHATKAGLVFKEYGALQLVECWGDDIPEGKITSFPMAVKCKDDEVVVFSWILWPSKQVRDEGMKKAMEDSRLQPETNSMPFDGKRLIYGGFNMVVDI
ncbi:hypothetical protein Lsan_0920 [Legionella santicrucis]|uniref:RNA signal recognition particle 4.5S RNA n=1 Tax=Legionella santicrucis TaxID=45074 RepID=A0A0W0Z6L6_9GAMM|nr:DUF1428 domain-containing protein [Legionella santicrucis]KTD64590.1 hypothetical protein Lsan_0920 [Legionella santicrucis]